MRDTDPELFIGQRIPSRVWRPNDFTSRNRINRICADNRNYMVHQFTVPNDVEAMDYEVAFRIPMRSYCAMVIADCGRHRAASHPGSDGTPGGQDLVGNLRRIRGDDDDPVKSSNFRILADTHLDDSDLPHNEAGYNLAGFEVGDALYVSVLQVGSSRPGRNLVVSAYIVPVRIPGLDF